MKRCSIRCGVLLGLLSLGWGAAGNAAEAPRQSETPPSTAFATESRWGPTGSIGVGFGWLGLTDATTTLRRKDEYGVAIEGRVGYRFGRFVGLNIGTAWSIGHFNRTEVVGKAGVSVAKWVTGALKSYTNWMKKGDRDGSFAIGWIGYPFIALMYLAVPAVFAVAPLAATNFASTALTLSGHLGNEGIDSYVEAGIGGMVYAHPVANLPLLGYGPVLGGGVTIGRIGLKGHVLWSPPGAQAQTDGLHTHVYALTLTLSYGW